MTETVEARVARGAEWLDEQEPGWERRIDLAALDLEDGCRCVLGHVFNDAAIVASVTADYIGGYQWALRHFEKPWAWARGHGFLWKSGALSDIDALDEAWISLVKTRFDTGALSDETGGPS